MSDNGPPVQFEILHFVIELVLEFLAQLLLVVENLSLFNDVHLALGL